MVNGRRSFMSDSVDSSRSMAFDEYVSSLDKLGPKNADKRTCMCAAEKSCVERPFTESTIRAKESLLPTGNALGSCGEGLGDAAPFVYLVGKTTLTTFTSIRHEPMASAVYLQKIGATQVDDMPRDSGANDMVALPIKE